MSMIMELRGIPPLNWALSGARWKHFFTKEGRPIIFKNAKGIGYLPGSKIVKEVLKCEDPDFVSFIEVN